MFSEEQILAKARLVVDIVNSELFAENKYVEKVFLVGSYASGKQDEWSDIDFVVVLSGVHKAGMYYPTWKQIEGIQKKVDSKRIHVIFGTEAATKSLHEKHKYEKKTYAYRELKLNLKEFNNADSCTPIT